MDKVLGHIAQSAKEHREHRVRPQGRPETVFRGSTFITVSNRSESPNFAGDVASRNASNLAERRRRKDLLGGAHGNQGKRVTRFRGTSLITMEDPTMMSPEHHSSDTLDLGTARSAEMIRRNSVGTYVTPRSAPAGSEHEVRYRGDWFTRQPEPSPPQYLPAPQSKPRNRRGSLDPRMLSETQSRVHSPKNGDASDLPLATPEVKYGRRPSLQSVVESPQAASAPMTTPTSSDGDGGARRSLLFSTQPKAPRRASERHPGLSMSFENDPMHVQHELAAAPPVPLDDFGGSFDAPFTPGIEPDLKAADAEPREASPPPQGDHEEGSPGTGSPSFSSFMEEEGPAETTEKEEEKETERSFLEEEEEEEEPYPSATSGDDDSHPLDDKLAEEAVVEETEPSDDEMEDVGVGEPQMPAPVPGGAMAEPDSDGDVSEERHYSMEDEDEAGDSGLDFAAEEDAADETVPAEGPQDLGDAVSPQQAGFDDDDENAKVAPASPDVITVDDLKSVTEPLAPADGSASPSSEPTARSGPKAPLEVQRFPEAAPVPVPFAPGAPLVPETFSVATGPHPSPPAAGPLEPVAFDAADAEHPARPGSPLQKENVHPGDPTAYAAVPRNALPLEPYPVALPKREKPAPRLDPMDPEPFWTHDPERPEMPPASPMRIWGFPNNEGSNAWVASPPQEPYPDPPKSYVTYQRRVETQKHFYWWEKVKYGSHWLASGEAEAEDATIAELRRRWPVSSAAHENAKSLLFG